ncbi:hypothetical protein ES703_124254 [subsurface metagenome]
MRVAIFLAASALALASSPSIASPACMTQAEARAKFPTQHLWWHGANRCWDATPGRRQLAKRIEARKQVDAEPEVKATRAAPEEKKPEEKKPAVSNERRWRDAMSRMRPEDFAGSVGSARAEASADPSATPAVPRINFFERWVDIAQSVPPIAGKAAPGTDPVVRSLRAVAAAKSQGGLACRTAAKRTKAAQAVLRFSITCLKSFARLRK